MELTKWKIKICIVKVLSTELWSKNQKCELIVTTQSLILIFDNIQTCLRLIYHLGIYLQIVFLIELPNMGLCGHFFVLFKKDVYK